MQVSTKGTFGVFSVFLPELMSRVCIYYKIPESK